jgi:hypothetical protein
LTNPAGSNSIGNLDEGGGNADAEDDPDDADDAADATNLSGAEAADAGRSCTNA